MGGGYLHCVFQQPYSLLSGTVTVSAWGQLVIQAQILCYTDITWRKPAMLVKGNMGRGKKNIFKSFPPIHLLHLPLKSLLSVLQQLNSHKYINSKQSLISPEMFQVFGCCQSSWNSCLLSLMHIDSLQNWFWGKEPAACGSLGLPSQKPQYTGVYIPSVLKKKKKKKDLA